MKRRLSARAASLEPQRSHHAGRPLGSSTRGKTAPGRLRQVDAFCALYAADLLRRPHPPDRRPCFVDLGFGEAPWTTLASAEVFRRLAPGLRVLGLEIDRARVAAAAPFADADTRFRLGGFDLGLGLDDLGRREEARLLRAFNVLRQYQPEAVVPALVAMGRGLEEEGLLIEGSSDPQGQLWSAHLWRRRGAGLHHEALVFGLRGAARARAMELPSILPKDLIHRMGTDSPVTRFFAAWRLTWQESAGEAVWGPGRRLAASVSALQRLGLAVDARARWLSRGLVLWQGDCGLPDLTLCT